LGKIRTIVQGQFNPWMGWFGWLFIAPVDEKLLEKTSHLYCSLAKPVNLAGLYLEL